MKHKFLTLGEHKEKLNAIFKEGIALAPAVVLYESVFFVLGFTLAAVGARLWWPLELLVHFRFQYALALGLGFIASMLLKRWKVGCCALAGCLFNGYLVAPYVVPNSVPTSRENSALQLRVASVNVLTSNSAFAAVRDFLINNDPDLAVLSEIDQRWTKELASLNSLFPYQFLHPRPDNFGIGIFSKFPLENCSILKLGPVPAITADVKVASHQLHVVGVHLVPPTSYAYSSERNLGLRHLGEHLSTLTGPRLVVGDLNMTAHSPYFQDFIKAQELNDASLGQGLQFTWHTQLRPLLWVTIDHLLYSNDLKLFSRRTGDSVGSDHYPVLGDFEFLK